MVFRGKVGGLSHEGLPYRLRHSLRLGTGQPGSFQGTSGGDGLQHIFHRRPFLLCSVRILPVTDLHDLHHAMNIVNDIHNPVISLADSILILPRYFIEPSRSWIDGKIHNPRGHPFQILFRKHAQFFFGGPLRHFALCPP